MLGVTFTLLFSGGMIPGFLVVKSLGLMNSYWAVILPGAINAFNMIILKNFFQQLPTELEESAEIDGANEFVVLIRIILPLSMPAIATFTLFYAVAHWNSFFSAVLYLNDAEKWPIQVLLRQVVLMAQGGIGDSTSFDSEVVIPPQTVKMATIAISTAPVLAFYPLLQRHFTKGILVGSIKG
jgi:putative aldouronate transport system permease protein